jgi:hypothetical protein
MMCAALSECLAQSLRVPDPEHQRLYRELAAQWLVVRTKRVPRTPNSLRGAEKRKPRDGRGKFIESRRPRWVKKKRCPKMTRARANDFLLSAGV